MKWKNRLTNYNFWISIISAVLLILQAFKINFDIAYINEIATAVLGLLVVIGIISDPTRTVSNAVEATKPTLDKNVAEETKSLEEDIPTHDKNAVNYADIQNDFKVLVDQISQDLARMTQSNINMMNEMQSNKSFMVDKTVESSVEEDEVKSQTSYNIVNQ